MRNILLLIFLILISCKHLNKTKADGLENVDSTTVPNEFEDQLVFEIEMTVLENDIFEVYHRGKGEQYSVEKRLGHEVNGDSLPKIIRFIFDQHTYPYNLRFDFGSNPNQKPIKIESIKLRYNEGVHIFTRDELKLYFIPNKYLDFNFETLTATTSKLGNKYDPYLDSNNISKFINELILY